MRTIVSRLCVTTLICLSTSTPAMAEEDPALEAMQATFEFAPYQGGNILPGRPRAGYTRRTVAGIDADARAARSQSP